MGLQQLTSSKSMLLLGVTLLFLGLGCTADEEADMYLFSFFKGNGEDGLHLAYSADGLSWEALKNNESFLPPAVGRDKLMRDPCIIKGPDDTFHMVWTVSWNEKGIGYANSKDLIHWSEQQYIPVFEHEPMARNCWAPELFYDDASEEYLIYWATTIVGRYPETDSTGDDGYNHRMYYTTTKDFTSFSETKLLFDQGFNVIDATIHKTGTNYTMFLKNETLLPQPEKNIRIATSTDLLGTYTPASAPITPNWVEGPTAIETEKGWMVYFDQYTEGRMGAIISTDLQNWTNISHEVFFPEGTRHGTVFKVKKRILGKLLSLSSR